MKPETTTTEDLRHFSALLGGEPELLCAWVEGSGFRRLGLCSGVILAGAGLYGAAMGYWRAPLQALFVAVKFPPTIFLTTIGNAMLNALLAPPLGAPTNLAPAFFSCLLSFPLVVA